METFHCLANKGDKEDLHFDEMRKVGEVAWDKDAKRLADWLFKNLGAGPYRAMKIQLRHRETEFQGRVIPRKLEENQP